MIKIAVPIDINKYMIYTEWGTTRIDTGLGQNEFESGMGKTQYAVSDGLKTCPFCGEPPVAKFDLDSEYHIKCARCDFELHGPYRDTVIGRWNTRMI